MKAQTDTVQFNFPAQRPEPIAVQQLGFDWSEDRMHGTEQEKLLEAILASDNLRRAWVQVKANAGAAGMDGMNIADFPKFWQKHHQHILQAIEAGKYTPAPVRRVYIPKPNGDQRPLSIPTVLDRVIQQAIAQKLSLFFEEGFSEHSYGFRPERNTHQAIKAIQHNAQQGYNYVVDCDLKSFFDTVNHQVLFQCLKTKVKDLRVLKLINKYLQAGTILPDATKQHTRCGVPQGGPLSPLLSNILLDRLDKELEKRRHKFVRYADDFLVQVKSPRAAKRVMHSLTRFLSKQLKVIVNTDKSKTCTLAQCEFLGFKVSKKRIRWTDKSLQRFISRIKELTGRSQPIPIKERIYRLRLYIKGWLGYFWPGVVYAKLIKLDQWIRRRVRLCYWKQWKTPKNRRRNLLKLGINTEEVHLASRSRKGYWRMAGNSIVQRALNVQYLKEQGLPSLKQQWIHLRYPDQIKLG